jgi:hypothetical protein
MADEEWLPERPVAPPKEGSAMRTLVLWVVLIAMFIAIYTMFGNDDGVVTQEPVGYRGYWIAIAAIAGFLIPIAFVIWQFSGHRKFNEAQGAALEALAQDRPMAAAEMFAELARQNRTRLMFHAVASYNHGYALLRAGESARAVGILLRVDRTPKIRADFKTLTQVALARSFALGGDLAKANAWLDAAKANPTFDNPIYGRAVIASVEALVRCREGAYDKALDVLEANWSLLEHYLAIDLMAEPWLVRAFSTTMLSTARDAAAAEPWLRALRIMSPEQSRWLTHHWPELLHFATTHDVLRGSPAIESTTTPSTVSSPAS